MNKNNRISPEKLLKRFTTKRFNINSLHLISTPQISDAMKKLNLENHSLKWIKPRTDNKLYGSAITVKTDSSDWGTVVKAIEMADKGQVIVIYAENDDQALWGELTSKMAQIKGIAGTVVLGASRDLSAIKSLNYPLFSLRIVPNAGEPLNEGEINVTITFEGITIEPGDIIIGDDCGVLVIPKSKFDDVMKQTFIIKNTEKEILNKIEKGYSLFDILGLS
ncbi:MAG: RraA family protein [Methanomicrobiales archaeon]